VSQAETTGTEHRPEFAIPLHLPLWIETEPAPGRPEPLRGYALAVGWDRPQNTTFYLVSGSGFPRPVWIPEDAIVASAVRVPE
jgi:hypothetical protein